MEICVELAKDIVRNDELKEHHEEKLAEYFVALNKKNSNQFQLLHTLISVKGMLLSEALQEINLVLPYAFLGGRHVNDSIKSDLLRNWLQNEKEEPKKKAKENLWNLMQDLFNEDNVKAKRFIDLIEKKGMTIKQACKKMKLKNPLELKTEKTV
ncbi:hypothetical protein AUK11_00655 [bacterium CG2_30_37_16]|nr:MAG: hypothetical protein AUK11_00655 [bacterium CG2_30_37_16]PIP30370.1 MAG: hypothetical protein COX25_05050 [bacterium (Candidatus Howlettbacteria) CG23_combo_of_CG06-09_8_20_14_all_37_9]PJB06976.1 MAG: hypothetical protein CO123_00940 [bacterium (Candidatus Howlettbacteria) CG_4_9_14_3_um_filter_37_10]